MYRSTRKLFYKCAWSTIKAESQAADVEVSQVACCGFTVYVDVLNLSQSVQYAIQAVR